MGRARDKRRSRERVAAAAAQRVSRGRLAGEVAAEAGLPVAEVIDMGVIVPGAGEGESGPSVERLTAEAECVRAKSERRRADTTLARAVKRSRAAGLSWDEIAALTGVGREALRRRFTK